MSEPTITIQRIFRTWTQLIESVNDGTGRVTSTKLGLQVTMVTKTFDPNRPADELENDAKAFERMKGWVNQYLHERDARQSLHFTPSAGNLAIYLARVFSGIYPDFESVEVTLNSKDTARASASRA